MIARWTGRMVAIAAVAAVVGGAALWWSRPMPAPAATAPPPPQVGVVQLAAADVPLPLDFSGRVAGFRDVEIRSQVGGIVLKREYAEGAGRREEVLFRIDPRPYQVALDRAQAQLAQAQASFVQAQQNFGRIDELARRQVTTQKQLDDARGTRDQADAAVKLAQAEVNSATLNLGYTTVRAPVAGMTTLRSPPEGHACFGTADPADNHYPARSGLRELSLTDDDYKSLRDLNRSRSTPIKPEDITVELRYGDGSSMYARANSM